MSPEYKASQIEMDDIERTIVNFARSKTSKDVAAVVVPPTIVEANFCRTGEQQTFDKLGEGYDFAEGMAPYESSSVFLYTVNTEHGRIAHAKRLVHANVDNRTDGLTGIEPIDDRLTAGEESERADLDTILRDSDLTMDSLRTVVNVATNFTTRRLSPKTTKVPYATLSYLSVFKYVTDASRGRNAAAILAYLNSAAKDSLGRIKVESRLLGGKPFHLPKSDGSGYDERYEAVVIPDSRRNKAIFTTMGRFVGIPVIDYK